MEKQQQLEFWLRGAVPGITPFLQPVAHALLQAQLEVHQALEHFPDVKIWDRPAGSASVAFHLQHLAGVLDRLFTYAREGQLSSLQLDALQKEGKEDNHIHLTDLLQIFNNQVERAIDQLKNTAEGSLLATRGVGRKQILSNVLGLLFHAAEHTQRHTGQLLVTAKVVSSMQKK
jgi:uncharacterized damage-inducible protein DinB